MLRALIGTHKGKEERGQEHRDWGLHRREHKHEGPQKLRQFHYYVRINKDEEDNWWCYGYMSSKLSVWDCFTRPQTTLAVVIVPVLFTRPWNWAPGASGRVCGVDDARFVWSQPSHWAYSTLPSLAVGFQVLLKNTVTDRQTDRQTHTLTHIHTHTHAHAHTHTHTHTRTHAHTDTHTHTRTHTHTNQTVLVHTHTHARTHAHTDRHSLPIISAQHSS